MIRIPLFLSCLVGVGIAITTSGEDPKFPEYYRASHGFGGGIRDFVNLSELAGFERLRTRDDIAKFVSEVPDAIGFTCHPNFESGDRYARAVIWYTGLSATNQSWPLYLFDELEASKEPGDEPRASALKMAEARVSVRAKEAKELIEAGGEDGVLLSGDYQETKMMAAAVLQLGGLFRHKGKLVQYNGEASSISCGGCRSVVPGGTPRLCGVGLEKRRHWSCCGADPDARHCRYWELIQAKDKSQAGG